MGHWFKHDSDARHDEKLTSLRTILGKSAICDWWDLCEILSEKSGCKYPKKFLAGLQKDLQLSADELQIFIKALVDLELLQECDTYIYSTSLIKRLEAYEIKKESNAERQRRHREELRLQKEKEEREKQERDRGVTEEAQVSHVTCDTSNSNSISKSISNKKEDSQEFEILIDEIQLESAMLEYSRQGLTHADVERGYKYLENHFSKPENRHKNTKKAQYTALVTWVLQEVIEEKTKATRLQRATAPPKSKTEIERERRAAEEAELNRKLAERDAEDERKEQEQRRLKNETNGIKGLLEGAVSGLSAPKCYG